MIEDDDDGVDAGGILNAFEQDKPTRKSNHIMIIQDLVDTIENGKEASQVPTGPAMARPKVRNSPEKSCTPPTLAAADGYCSGADHSLAEASASF